MSSKAVQTKKVSTEIGKIYEGRTIEGFRLTIAVNDLGKGRDFSIGQWDRAAGILKGEYDLGNEAVKLFHWPQTI